MKKDSVTAACRERWAISLCFSAAVLLSLEALHSNAGAWLHMTADQSFCVSAVLATLSTFLGTFLLTRFMDK